VVIIIQLYTVWRNDRISIDENEKCLLRDDGNYIGLETGKVYDKNEHYHSKQFKGKIISIDNDNLTGMYHLYKELNDNEEENNYSFKQKYLGCYVTLERAHFADGLQIYRCNELEEYFSEKEIELL
jgi:hypothetical protein